MWDNTKCLPAGMPNSILLKVMLLWIRNDGILLPAAIGAKMGMPDRKWLQLSVMVDSK
jgi:thiamine pyrophosphate-dependent acetolactate synthase large subunit-like protein